MSNMIDRELTEDEVKRAGEFCHAFVRFIISEGVTPQDGVVYVAAAAAQIVRNVEVRGNVPQPIALATFMHNIQFFLDIMSETATAYPTPRKDN